AAPATPIVCKSSAGAATSTRGSVGCGNVRYCGLRTGERTCNIDANDLSRLLGRCGCLAGGAAKGGRDVGYETVHLLAHKRIGAVAKVEVEDDLVDADRLDALQGVNDLLGRAIEQ